MSSKSLIGVIAVAALLLSIVNWFHPNVGQKELLSNIGGAPGNLLAENYDPYIMYNDGYSSAKAITLSGANGDITTGDDLTVTDDATISGGSLTVTTAANATSTIVVGGIQTYATSAATAICLVPVATSTNMLTGNSLAIQAKYGTCPF